MTSKRPWADEENERLEACVTNNTSLLRSMGSVRNQARKLGTRFPTIREYKTKLGLQEEAL